MKKYIYALTITLGLCHGKAYGAAAGNPEDTGDPCKSKRSTASLEHPLLSKEEMIKHDEKRGCQILAIPNRFHYDPEKTDAQNRADFIKVLEGISSGSEIAVFFPDRPDYYRLLNDVEGATLNFKLTKFLVAKYTKK